jgi:acetylornithine deacetylase/succinyl-diaminopimelate desuccinylase-like protein
MPSPHALPPVLDRLDADLDAALDRLMSLLRIPSISTDPAFTADVRAAAEALSADLNGMGVRASVRDTTGHPMVVGHIDGPEGAPHVLFYGHYDVQPVDPLRLWDRDPFDPAIEDTAEGKVIRGRGSSDDKGQLMTFVEACRAWLAEHRHLPVSVTFLFEGEEESGSPSLVPFLEANREELSCDIALICDTGLFAEDSPAITTMLRGLLGEEITITGPDKDLHSGAFGGPAQNPIRVLTRILAGLHDEQGRVTVPGFYDGVPVLTNQMRADWANLGFDEAAFLGGVGLTTPAGEREYTVLEQIWARPTCEFNGITGGYTGDGFKTVLPSQATAKVSFRLVGTQDPLAIRESFRAMVTAQVPEDCTVSFADHGASPASVMATDHPAFAAARAALSDEWPKPAAFIGAGGSIPIAGYFKTILGMDSMLIGFGRDDDRIHSPNEKYDLKSFHKGMRSWARVLAAL